MWLVDVEVHPDVQQEDLLEEFSGDEQANEEYEKLQEDEETEECLPGLGERLAQL